MQFSQNKVNCFDRAYDGSSIFASNEHEHSILEGSNLFLFCFPWPPLQPMSKIISGYQWLEGEPLGYGAWGKVRRVVRVEDGVLCAVKIYHRYTLERKIKGNGVILLRKEYELMRSLSHFNIVKYFELDEDSNGDKIYLFMELADGSLDKEFPVSSSSVPSFSAETAAIQRRTILKILCQQMLQTLSYLQTINVSHHDIKPANILYQCQDTGSIQFKLADFGVAERYGEEGCRTFFGTPSYQAPEVVRNIDGSPFDGIKADLWSLGVTIYQLVYGRLPFEGETVYLVMKSIDEDEIKFPTLPSQNATTLLKSDNELLLDFLQRLLTKDVDKRSSITECLEHPWLKTASPTTQVQTESLITCCTIV